MQITTFGGLQILLNDEPVSGLVSRKAEALLVYLAAATRPLPRELLADLLWDDRSQQQSMSYLRVVLSSLRKQLAPFLAITRHTAALDPDANVRFDAAELEGVLSQVNLHGGAAGQEEVQEVEAAVSFYQGDFLAGFHIREASGFEEWATVERERLRQLALDGLDSLVAFHLEDAGYQAGIRHVRHLLRLDPLRETAHRQMMQLLAYSGRSNEAITHYESCRQLLWDELGVEPSAETEMLLEAISSGDFEMIHEDRGATSAPEHSISTPPLPAFLESDAKEPERPVFVARERQLSDMDEALKTALAGNGRVLFITGGPGRGKSALTAEFGRRAQESHPDLLVAGGSCNAFSGIGDPYLPFREVMGMLTGDVEAQYAAGSISGEQARRLWGGAPRVIQAILEHGPSLFDSILPGRALHSRAVTMALGSPWLEQLKRRVEQARGGAAGVEQSHLFQQLTNVLGALASEQPLLLLLDDMQWSDNASISLLFHLGRRLAGQRVLVCCAYRPEEVALGRGDERHPLEKVLAEFKRLFGDVSIDLAGVEKAEDRAFVDALLETVPNHLGDEFRTALTRQTGGNPLFAVELLRAMQEKGDLIRDKGHWVEGPTLDWGTLPARVEATIAERIGRLEKEHREILSTASVEGEVFTAQVVAQVQGVGERKLLQGLSGELEQRHQLVRELGEIEVGSRRLFQYRFSHDLFQRYLYESLSLGERRLLHGEVAAALEAHHEGAIEGIAVQLARHYSQAGKNKSALKYLEMAGTAANAAYAYQEAEAHFRHALVLNPSPLDRANLLGQLGTSLSGQHKLQESIQTWNDAIQLYRTLGPEGLDGMARLYGATALAATWESPPEALEVCQTGLRAVAGAPDGSGLGLLLLQTARAYHFNGSPEEAWDFCHQAMAMAGRLGDVRLQAEILASQGLFAGQPAQESINTLRKAVELAESVGEDATALGALGNLSNRVPDLEARRDNYLRAAGLARQYGGSEAYYLGALSLHALRKLGALDESEAMLNRMRQQLADPAEEWWTAIMITRLAEAALMICQGEWAQAIELLRECQADARRRGARQYLMYSHADLALALMESGILADGPTAGGWEEAEKALTEAVGLGEHLHTATEQPTLQRCYLIKLRSYQGQFSEAHALLGDTRAARDAAGLQINRMTEAYLLSAEAVLAAAEGDYAEAIKTFAEAVETFEQLGMRWDHARILADWAGAHLARKEPGDKRRARELLQESLTRFEDMGAPGYEAVVEERLLVLAQ